MLPTTRIKYTLCAILVFVLLSGCTQAGKQAESGDNSNPTPTSAESAAASQSTSTIASTSQSPSASANTTPKSSESSAPISDASSPISAASSPVSTPNSASLSTAAAPHSTIKQSLKPSPNTANSTDPAKHSPDHIVIVIEENHSYSQIVGNTEEAPYMQSLIQRGALFTNAHGVTHPSQPNYLALFSGSMQGTTNDACKKPFNAPNLASSLVEAKLTFTGYSENLPKAGFTGCSSKDYARKHNPWVQFTNVPEHMNQPFTSFPDDFSQLPTVSFVVPSMEKDMHDGTVLEADNWLRDHMEHYVSWAEKHNSMLILTWDEDNFAKANHIPLILVGPMVKAGSYDTEVNHYNVLRTIEELYQLPFLGESKNVKSMFYSLSQ